MSALPSQQGNLFADTVQVTKLLHRTDKRCRYAMEVGGMGLILLVGMSLFGGSPGSGGGASGTSYNPPPQTGAPVNPGNPSISRSQLNTIQQQAGGGNVLNTVPVAPIKANPVMKEDEVRIEGGTTDSSDPFTYTEKPKGPRPIYQETK